MKNKETLKILKLIIDNYEIYNNKEGIEIPLPNYHVLNKTNHIQKSGIVLDEYYLSYEENFKYLEKNGILSYINKEECIGYDIEQTNYKQWASLYNINFLKAYQLIQEIEGNNQKSIIKPITLEKIARFVGEKNGGYGLQKLLKECNVPEYLIVYPNTKWRMVDDIFRLLATSKKEEDHNLLFNIIEEFFYPARFDSTEDFKKQIDFFNELLGYDGYIIKNGKISKVSLSNIGSEEINNQEENEKKEPFYFKLRSQRENEELKKDKKITKDIAIDLIIENDELKEKLAKKGEDEKGITKIKYITLGDDNFLYINNNTEIKFTKKEYKIIFLLYDKRKEYENGILSRKGDYISLESLRKCLENEGRPTINISAISSIIKRIQKKIKKTKINGLELKGGERKESKIALIIRKIK